MTFKDIKENSYDGMIITGAPVEQMPFEEVDYWNELCEILEWAKTHVFSSFFICWASQAALHYYYGIDKYLLKHKLTGVYRHHTNQRKMRRKILRGFDYQFYAPHSRYTTVLKEDVASNSNLDILAESDDAGVYLVASKDGSQFFVTGHPEYDPDTLDKEYHRDLAKGGDCVMPKNYYKNDDVNVNEVHDDFVVQFKSKSPLLLVFCVGIFFFHHDKHCEGLRPRVKHIDNRIFLPVYYPHVSKSALSLYSHGQEVVQDGLKVCLHWPYLMQMYVSTCVVTSPHQQHEKRNIYRSGIGGRWYRERVGHLCRVRGRAPR